MYLIPMANRAGIRILYVGRDPESAADIAAALEGENGSFTLETAPDRGRGLEQLTPAIDCIVSAYDLPGGTGVGFLEAVRERYPDLPFVLFTGEATGSESVASAAISADVTEYLGRGTDGDQYGALAEAILDSVEARRSLAALETMRSRMNLALESTDSTIFEVDFETRAETRYGPFERLFGLTSDCITTFDEFCSRCVHPADADRVRGLQQPEALSDETETLTYEFRTHPDYGEVRWIWAEAHVETGPDGEPRRLTGLNTDITDRKERERELGRQNERLEEFASVISHDLRNPLNVANLRVELAMQGTDSENLEVAMQSLRRMETLIDDLLTLARTGKRVTQAEPIELAAIAETSWHTVETGGATLTTETDRTVRADRNRLRQLLENLFRNAVEHGSTGSQSGTVDAVEHGSAGSQPTADDTVEHGDEGVTVTVGDCGDTGFYIADDGHGIPEADREEVFDSTYSTKEDDGGLGLSIVEAVVEAHGWEIGVADGETGGARFEITGVDVVT